MDLVKGLSADNQSPHGTQPSGQPRSNQSQPSPRRQDSYSSSTAIYASFISAVTGAISLQLVERYGALPLGSRTLFTAVERVGYDIPQFNNESARSTSCLTIINVQLTMTGSITASAQTVSQTGIRRLYYPQNHITDTCVAKAGIDVWLCPNGTVARLVTANIGSSITPSPDDRTPGNISAKQTQWKLDVVQWLRDFGMHIESIDEEPWVEVEVWEPFFARLAGEAWRQSDNTSSTLPLKRMLWPARFCFRRASSPKSSSMTQIPILDEPLDFAEEWSAMASSLNLNHAVDSIQCTPAAQKTPPKDQELASSPKVESTENIESLSRIAQYPDLHSTNLVYPTPPEGAASVGLIAPNPSEVLVEGSDVGIHRAAQKIPKADAPGSFSPSHQNNGIGIGTGRYDESDEEDLFGEINERDFGSKGITDADFSFFDDPDFEGLGGDERPEDLDQVPPPLHDQTYPEVDAMVDEAPSPDNSPEITNEVHHSPVHDEGKRERDQSTIPEEIAHLSTDRAAQTISPPLSPIEVKKILFPISLPADHNQSTDHQGQGHYLPVAFQKGLGDWDRKYGAAGKFWFSANASPDAVNQTSAIPIIGVPHGARRSANGVGSTDDRNAIGSSLSRTERSLRSVSISTDDSDDESVEVVSEHAPSPMTIPTIPSLKRKRASSDSDVISVASPEKSSTGSDASPANAPENSAFLGNFLANFSDWAFTGYFSASTPSQLPVILRREHQLPVAQLLVNQITQSSLRHPLDGHIGVVDLESQCPLPHVLDGIDLLGNASKLDLKQYTSLQDDFLSSQPPQQPPQYPSLLKEAPKSFIFKLPAPHVRIRRGKEYLEPLPPAISFWETFGLEPAHGPKNISAYCIHPVAASAAADVLLRRLGLLYQSCSLGHHARGECSLAFEEGLRPWQSESPRYESMMQVLKGLCEELGTLSSPTLYNLLTFILGSELAQSPPTTDNCVVYIINPFNHAAALADICATFWHLFQQMAADSERRKTRPFIEPVLQIIPAEFVMLSETMVVPPQSDYLNLALEVYSRCRPIDADMSPILSTPPLLLADPLQRTINFRLTSECVSPLEDGRILHIAWSRSLDQRWISVAWSDVPGSIQKTMSYCLRYRRSGGSRPISEVRQEIWATTKHIMDKLQARWKVQLVTTEPMEPDEVEGKGGSSFSARGQLANSFTGWANLAEQHNKLRPGSLELTILAVNVVTDLNLSLPCPSISMTTVNSFPSSTPVSTPNPIASIASPEQSGNAATPTSAGPAAYSAPTPTDMSLDTDPEAVLIDICDESWLVILSHRLNSSPHLTEFRPALSSGYLLRRKGPTDADGVFAISVNLIYSPRPAQSHDNVLKKTLSMYRDMGCLARAKGTCSVQNNTLPWHIATALRGQELLSYVF